MAKRNKNNHPVYPPPLSREAITTVQSEEDFVELLRRELEWPIPINVQRLDDVAIPHDLQRDFGFKPEEDRIAVSRLLNLTEEQPWGVFLFEFKTKRPYLSHLRQLLRVLGSQRSLRRGDPVWDRNDLLFICTSDWQQFQFVHFAGAKPENAVISSFGWKGPDDPFLYTLCKHNLPRLRMPQPGEGGSYDVDAWRTAWLDAFSIKPVTDEFYATLKEVFDAVQSGVIGLEGENRRFFAELVVNRMVFLKFVEKKGWLDGDRNYLCNRFQSYGRKNYWKNFLCDFFFEGLCKEKDQRTAAVNEQLGDVPFMNAELFAPSDKWDDRAVKIENRVFDLLFDRLLNPYNFTVSETSPLDVEVAFNQDLLGYGYEELIADQHGQGAYYTHPTEVNLMCRESLRAYLEGRCPEVDTEVIGKLVYAELATVDIVAENDALSLYRALHDVTVVDPALGSGTFPVAMMKHLFLALRTLGNLLAGSSAFRMMLKDEGITDPEDTYALKLHIIERSIYGCDIDYFAVQIAKLRFWIELMVECDKPEALPNFNCKLLVGDALLSVVGTDSNGEPVVLEKLLGHPTKGQMTVGHLAVERLSKLKSEYFSIRDTEMLKNIDEQIRQTRMDLLRSVGIEPDMITLTDKHILWQIDFAEIFSGETLGFDIAIANPPYLRQELINQTFLDFKLNVTKSILIRIYTKLLNKDIDGKSDLYIYFFFRCHMLSKVQNGVVCFICSNSWLDVEYGASLQHYLLIHTRIHGIYASEFIRSFSNAAINTAISIAVNCTSVIEDKKSKFFLFYKSFNEINATVCSDEVDTGYRCRTVSNNQLIDSGQVGNKYKGSKWYSFYIKAPDYLLSLLAELSDYFVALSDIANVSFGIKTGANDFFLLSTEDAKKWGIEKKFLMPIAKSPRDCPALNVNIDALPYYMFYCNILPQNLRGTNALDYIKWGESKGFSKNASVRTRKHWYSLGEKIPAPINCGYLIHDCMRFYVHSDGFFASDNFHSIYPKKSGIEYSIALASNSSISQLWINVTGRSNFGDGLLKVQAYEASKIPIINPKFLDEKEAQNLLIKSGNMSIESKERTIVDSYIISCLGIRLSADDIQEELINLYKQRIGKVGRI